MKNSNLKWTDKYINELKLKAKEFDEYAIYDSYCEVLDEIVRIVKENEYDYNDMRKFQEKFMKANSELIYIKDSLDEYFEEIRKGI
jgi:hypothetical protein